MSFSGLSLRQALRLARKLQCQVHAVRRTGEVHISHPSLGQRVRVNARRKDASRKFTALLWRLYSGN